MRKFLTGGYAFYMLNRGERAPDPLTDKSFCGAYLIWPRKSGFWDVREFKNGSWQEVTKELFDSENAAFNYVYKRYCDKYNRTSPKATTSNCRALIEGMPCAK
ncbi:hypothetical protein RIN65_10345 [Pantoea agglomerans]|uniref:hypothetical protein n=1 Tax=Enterobacter agglomerans TaxID=549 RepID=UPI0028C48B69|nr:hypothetical protein [Pantoea agglomerans]WNN32982.1 hypothetical protein RIN65_10345 [Pantoea agglomerans]